MKKIFEESKLAGMQLKNRLWRSSTWLNLADEKGHITDALEKEYLRLAKGGVGTILTGYANICEEEAPNPGMLGIYEDSFIPEYQAFTAKLKKYDVNVIMQICYGGSFTNYNTEGRLIFGPSEVAHPLFNTVPTEMTEADIEYVIKAHVDAVMRVKESGFDGVQLHSAHSYLLSQFLSPYFNRRNDSYGGSIENRSRIIRKVVQESRRKVGPDFPILIKMHCSDDWDENGLNEEDSLYVAKMLEKEGITAIEFSGGNLDYKNCPNKGPGRTKIIKAEAQSYFAEKTARIAKELSIPVISVGGHRDFHKIEELLNSSNIEYFSLSRPLLSEPDLVNRWEGGDYTKPRCVACSLCWNPTGNNCIIDRKKSTQS